MNERKQLRAHLLAASSRSDSNGKAASGAKWRERALRGTTVVDYNNNYSDCCNLVPGILYSFSTVSKICLLCLNRAKTTTIILRRIMTTVTVLLLSPSTPLATTNTAAAGPT